MVLSTWDRRSDRRGTLVRGKGIQLSRSCRFGSEKRGAPSSRVIRQKAVDLQTNRLSTDSDPVKIRANQRLLKRKSKALTKPNGAGSMPVFAGRRQTFQSSFRILSSTIPVIVNHSIIPVAATPGCANHKRWFVSDCVQASRSADARTGDCHALAAL